LGQFWDNGVGTISKRGDKQWQAKVRVKGYPSMSRTFDYKADAEKWVQATERELQTSGFVDRREAEKTTFGTVLKRYAREITPTKKSMAMEAVKIGIFLKDPVLPFLKMSAITSTALAEWRDRRSKTVGPASILRELGILSAVLNHARREWGIHIENPIRYVKRPTAPRARERRLSADEERYLIDALQTTERSQGNSYGKGIARNPWLAPLVRLAIETAMRRGELLSLAWEHVDLKRQVAHLPDTKNGDPRDVPLSKEALKILQGLPRNLAGSVFPTTAEAIKQGFSRALKHARASYFQDCEEAQRRPSPNFLEDVHFHDLRHEAASRLAEKLPNLIELSSVTGHRDLRMLKRYYHPRAEDLAKKLG